VVSENQFELLTPVIYWLLIILWSIILVLYFRVIRDWEHTSAAMKVLLWVLVIDSIRTLFESIYFGGWYSAKMGLLPHYIYESLVQPQNVFIPKLINVIAGFIILVLLLRRWLPNLAIELKEQSLKINDLHSMVESRTRELQQSENKYRMLFESSSDAIMLLNKQGFLDCNSAALKMFDCASRDKFLNLHPSDLSPPTQSDGRSSQEAADEKIASAYQAGRAFFEWTHRRSKEQDFPAEVLLTRLTLDGKNILQATVRDISERKGLETQLIQAQKMDAVGTLVGGIAHDFNNMLAGITGNLYLIRKRTKDMPDTAQKFEAIEKIAFSASEMIKQLLTFSRKGEVDMTLIPLTPFIKESLQFLCTSVPENIAIHQDISGDSLQVQGDATQLHQMLMNLINNARDALEGVDNPCISISLAQFHADDLFIQSHPSFKAAPYAHLSVEDNGCGIPHQQIEHLFEPFFTTKEVGKGTGLGLAMVFGAIKTHLGFIEVESTDGKGSTFHIYLPLDESIEAVSAPLHEEVIEGYGETILVVDDEESIRRNNREILESMNYKVLEASNGLEAVDQFSENQHEIALILTDLVMPKLGGVEAVNRIRKVHPNVKVIISTGYDNDEVLQANSVAGNYAVLSKPFSVETLSKVIRDQLDS